MKKLVNQEFENKISDVRNRLKEYLTEKNYELTELKIEELIQWKDAENGEKIVYIHEKCPEDIVGIVKGFIIEGNEK